MIQQNSEHKYLLWPVYKKDIRVWFMNSKCSQITNMSLINYNAMLCNSICFVHQIKFLIDCSYCLFTKREFRNKVTNFPMC